MGEHDDPGDPGGPLSEVPSSSERGSENRLIRAINPAELHLSAEELSAISIRSPRVLVGPAAGSPPPAPVAEQPEGGAAHPRIGEVIGGRYEVLRLLGEGAMAAVFEALDLERSTRVALKLMHDAYADSPELVARFRQEARAARAVESPHIIKVFDVGGDERSTLYLAMEILSGEDLESTLLRSRRLHPEVACVIAAQAAAGLAAAHAAGVVHRDVKPSNLFLAREPDGGARVSLLDFGIAKPDDGRAAEALTRVGTVLGTPQYMAPEAALAQGKSGPGVDVFALGTVLFEMLTGSPAIAERTTIQSMLVAVATQSVPRLADVLPGVAPGLDALVADMTLRDPSRRIGSMNEVLARLADLGARDTSPLRWADLDRDPDAPPAAAAPEAPTSSPPGPHAASPTQPALASATTTTPRSPARGWLVGGLLALVALTAIIAAILAR
jgi:eukaryotic-like serine/threonine-protein kinase